MKDPLQKMSRACAQVKPSRRHTLSILLVTLPSHTQVCREVLRLCLDDARPPSHPWDLTRFIVPVSLSTSPFLGWSRGVVGTLLLFKFIGSLDWSGRPRLQLAVSMPLLVIGLHSLTSNAGRLPRPLQHAKSACHCVLRHP